MISLIKKLRIFLIMGIYAGPLVTHQLLFANSAFKLRVSRHNQVEKFN